MEVVLNLAVHTSRTIQERIGEIHEYTDKVDLIDIISILLCECRTYGFFYESAISVGCNYCILYNLIPYIYDYEYERDGVYASRLTGREHQTQFLHLYLDDNLRPDILYCSPEGALRAAKSSTKIIYDNIVERAIRSDRIGGRNAFRRLAMYINDRTHILDMNPELSRDSDICENDLSLSTLIGGIS